MAKFSPDYNDSLIFPSDNSLGIPVLNPDLQARWIEKPCYSWGSVPRSCDEVHTWHFYTDDYRWSKLIKEPWHVAETKARICTELNISQFWDTAPALSLATIFRKRWASRYWQECGISIFVDLFVPQPLAEYNLLGVPVGWRAYSTRGVATKIDELDYDYEIAKRHAKTDDILFVVFAGGDKVADWCVERKAIHLPYKVKKARSRNGQ